MNYSSLGKRILGALIDGFAINLLSAIAYPFFGYYGILGVYAVAYAAYQILLQGGSRHATLGQMAFGMRVVNGNGSGIDYGTAAIRFFASLLSPILLGIGYIIALFSDEHQTLHDRIAGTYVVDAASSPYSSGGSSGASCRLIGISGEKAGMSFPISGNGLMIGRDTVACQVVMAKSAGVSRLHCLVSYNPASGMFIVTDRASRYGTFTESGVRITPQKSMALRSGERFYLGSKQNMFEVR
ncbi:MAG: RDD family protein [Oscillospiraceae bacterium]|nr:RDD family protein [Oscillospiraceae bacterium]